MAFIINSNNERFEVTGPIELKTFKYTHIKSMWSGFGGMASAGVNSLTNKLNQLFNTAQTRPEEQPVDYKAPFKAIEVDTGLSIELELGEVLQIHTPVNNASKGIVLACGDLMIDNGQIKLYFYNMTTTDTTINAGETVAIGVVHKVGNKTNINYIIDNTQTQQPGWGQQAGWGQQPQQAGWGQQPQQFGTAQTGGSPVNLKKG